MRKPNVSRTSLDDKAFIKAKDELAKATRETLALLNKKDYLKIELKKLPTTTKKLSKNDSVCRYA